MTGDLSRVMRGLTIGVVRETDARDKRAKALGLNEIEEQFQIPVGGAAGTSVSMEAVELTFDYPFYFAPGMRDSDFDVPQMTYGAQLDGAVIYSVAVLGWDRDVADESVKGATVGISVCAPGTTEGVSFGGFVHVTFQGFGALLEDETEMNQ